MNRVVSIALEAGCEISALATVILGEAEQVPCDNLLVRGVTARIAQLAGVIVEAINDGDDDETLRRLEKRLKGR